MSRNLVYFKFSVLINPKSIDIDRSHFNLFRRKAYCFNI